MILKAKKQSKGKKKKYPSSKAIPPDQKSLKMKILRVSFIAFSIVSGLNGEYVPLNPAEKGWKGNSTTSCGKLYGTREMRCQIRMS